MEKSEVIEETTRTSLIVVNGEQWWQRNHNGLVKTNDAGNSRPAPDQIDLDRHFSVSMLREFFVSLDLEQVGSVSTAGRSCVRLRATLREGARLWPHWLPHGADEYELHADLERGVLLYIGGRSAGKLFETCEVTEIAFDEMLDEALFTYAPADGEAPVSAGPIMERMSLQAAAARAPFVVLAPAGPPELAEAMSEVMYHPPESDSQHARLTLGFRGKGMLWITQANVADPSHARLEWEVFERQGKRLSLSDPGDGIGMRMLALEQQGTHVTIMSELDREQVIAIACALTPVVRA